MRPSLADAVRALVCARPSVQRVTPVEDGCESKEKKEKETSGVTATIKNKIRVGRYVCKELRGYNSRGEVQADAKRNGSNTLSFLLLFSHSFLFFFPFFLFSPFYSKLFFTREKSMPKTVEQPSRKKRKVNHSRKTMVTRKTYHCQVRAIREPKLESVTSSFFSSATTASNSFPSFASPPSSTSVLTRAILRGANSFEGDPKRITNDEACESAF